MNEKLKFVAKLQDLVRDASKAVVVGLIPIAGLIYAFRLVQWYRWRPEVDAKHAEGDLSDELVAGFYNARGRLWFGVLFWPGVIIATFVALFVGLGSV